MKRNLFLLAAGLSALAATAQIDIGMQPAMGKGGAGTAILRNWEAIGINPANLGWKENHLVSVGAFNFGVSAQSKALDAEQLREALQNPEDTFSTADKQLYSSIFTTPDGLNLQSNITWGSFSVATPKFGGLAVNLRDRGYAHVGLNHNAADILFNGQNAALFQDTATYSKTIGEILDSTNLSFMAYRELNIAYGRRIAAFGTEGTDGEKENQLFAGIGVKMLWGMAHCEAMAENKQLTGHASMSTNFGVNYGAIQNFDPQKTDLLFNSVGNGMAIDAGVSFVLKQKFRFGLALTDMGSIKWKNNLLITTDTTMTPLDTTNNGINSWNLGEQGSFAFANDGLFNYGPGPDYKTTLPSRLRIGAGIKLERFEIAADVVVPVSNQSMNISSPYFALGAEYNLLGFIKFSGGISGNGDWGLSVPVGLNVGFGGVVETGVATGDLLSLFGSSENPNLSVSFFILRININKPKPKDNALPTI
ncbi:MAG: hypothetical protein FD123_2500 [Bacteroidetes bacterium]|nr:MAG: hypothetical protein FD123_2500 [Bacteroidota bacterium]